MYLNEQFSLINYHIRCRFHLKREVIRVKYLCMPGVDDGGADEDASERVTHEGDPLRHLGHGVREHLVDEALRHRLQAGERVALQRGLFEI